MSTLNISTTDVLRVLYDPNETVCFRVFDDKKAGIFTGEKLSCECGKFMSLAERLKHHNALNRGIFFVVNSGGHDDASITKINAQFFEMDEGTFEEQWQKIRAFPLQPSMVIQTQKSLHVYYFVDAAAKVDRFRPIQKQLVKQFGGDPMCVNESRVMRLPGFNHCKTDTPVEVKCVWFHPEYKYTQDQLADLLPEVDEEPAEEKKGTERGLNVVTSSCDFMEYCKTNAASLSEPDWYAMITNLAPFVGGTERIHQLSAPYPDYTRENTQKKINHFLKSGTNPITCKTICEKGYQCPRFAAGECGVKSPAALCHKPMSVDSLLKALRQMPITGNATKDAQSAKEFVETYLYNQDMMTANTLIDSEVCSYFHLKGASCVKTLRTVYKESNKEYRSSKSARKENARNPAPDWYEETERGVRFFPGILAEHMANEAHVFYTSQQYYRYNGGVYTEIPQMQVQRLIKDKMLTRETRMAQIVDTEKQWQILSQRNLHEMNPNPYIINVLNGLYNVLDDKLEEHTPDYYSTVQLKVTYDKSAGCPLFKEFLTRAMCGDMEQVALIQEILGYCLIPINSAQKCFLFVGVAGAGKSILLRVLNEILLGKENVSNVSWQALNERFKTAELFGKLANIFADLPTKGIDDTGIFKALVGEDYLTAEKKNKDPFSFQSTAKLLFSCNSIPKNYNDHSEGFYRRLIIVRFLNPVPEEQRDSALLDKFQLEASGIFMFALEGLRRLMGNHYHFSETQVNKDALQQYREDSDSVLSFVKDNCELNAAYATGSMELFTAYQSYCKDCGLKPCAHNKFVQQLTTAFPDVARGVDTLGKRRVLKGIRIGAIVE